MTLMRVSAVWALVLALTSAAQAATIELQNQPSSAPSVERAETKAARGERVIDVRFNLKQLETTDVSIAGESFQKLTVDSLPLTSEVGAPALPFYAVTLAAAPADIEVETDLGEATPVEGVRAFPAQPEKCRCADDAKRADRFDAAAYRAPEGFYRVDVLGDFRGTPVTRVIVFPQRYDAASRKLMVHPKADFRIRVKGARASTSVDALIQEAARPDARAAYDYLILSPRAFLPALNAWMEHKQARGFRFKVLTLEDMGATVTALTPKIHAEYQANAFRYALIVGNQNKFPAHRVSTSGSSQTPSDLPYFAMGGANDTIPDVFAGRLVVQSAAEAERQLAKVIAYDKDTHDSSEGWTRALGVASNEGYNPSDDEYVRSIESKFQEKLGTTIAHFYQDDSASNPTQFNQEMGRGAMWMTYMGHGSGYSWPSFGQEYSISNIKSLRNGGAVKPVWIDVACQNGRLEPNMGGERMMNETDSSGRPIGAAAFYGGTVNISWHPPAILARGMAFRMLENDDLRVLGAVIQAGHVYLSENYSSTSELQYNQRWYVLQGDPSMTVRLDQ